MASQGSQATPYSRVCLAILKFSYATVAEGISAPIPWKHIASNNDLSVILDTHEISGPAGAIEKRQRFQVLQAGDVLEDIDLDILACEAQRSAVQMQSANSFRSYPLITIIAKLPCIAMRYPLAGGRVRRFQVRFTEDEGFYEMMKRLSKAGVPVIESSANTAQPPSMAGSETQRTLSTSQPSNNGYYDQRPGTATVCDYRSNSQAASTQHTMSTPAARPLTSGAFTMSQGVTSLDHGTQHCTIFNRERPNSVGTATDLREGLSSMAEPAPFNTPIQKSNSPYFPLLSSAPTSTITHPEQTMPPRRELPFPRKPKKSEAILVPATPTVAAISTEGGSSVAITSKEDMSSVPAPTHIAELQDQTVAKAAKRAASKPKKEPAPKKAKTTSSRKKADGKGGKQDNPVPSVEELLQQKMAEKDKDEIQQAKESSKVTKNPVSRGKSRPKSSSAGSKLSQTAKNTNEVRTQSASHALDKPGQTHLISDGQVGETLHFPNTIQGDISNAAKETNPPEITQLEPSLSTTSTSAKSKSAPGRTERGQQKQRPQPNLSGLGQAFTQPIDNGGVHVEIRDDQGDTSRETKRRAIESWICKQIDDDEFLDVCKMVESVWARALVRH